MRFLPSVCVLLFCLAMAIPASAAEDRPPTTFLGCILDGGDVRQTGNDLTCRLVIAWDFRVYYGATTECDEEIQLEHWGETRGGVITSLFSSQRTVELPEDTLEMDDVSIGTPIPCLND